jgi:hypothetical protein
MTKARGFSIVLQDVQNGSKTKADVISYLHAEFALEKAVVAEERYNHQDGSHIHVFYRVTSQVHFSAQLKMWTKWWTHGRVQVDVMRGEMAQACKYLQEGKAKHYDANPYYYPSKLIAVSPQQHADEWFNWFTTMDMAEYREISRRHRERFVQAYTQCFVL